MATTFRLNDFEFAALRLVHDSEQIELSADGPVRAFGRDATKAWSDAAPFGLIACILEGAVRIGGKSDVAIRTLERLGLIEPAPEDHYKLLCGTWTLKDGRTLELDGEVTAGDSAKVHYGRQRVVIDGKIVFEESGLLGGVGIGGLGRYFRATATGLTVLRSGGERPVAQIAATEALKPHSLDVLRALCESGERLIVASIEVELLKKEVFLGTRGIRERLNELIEKGLAHRPAGPNGGATITVKGRQFLKSFDSTK